MTQLTLRLQHNHPAIDDLRINQTVELTAKALVVGIESDLVDIGNGNALPADLITITLEVTKADLA